MSNASITAHPTEHDWDRTSLQGRVRLMLDRARLRSRRMDPSSTEPGTTISSVTPAGEVSETMRHDHGIIDHSRHVSSVGRR